MNFKHEAWMNNSEMQFQNIQGEFSFEATLNVYMSLEDLE